jgi:hypothetical protein
MPDSLMREMPLAAKPRPAYEYNCEERANRLHALIVAIYNHDDTSLNLSEDEAENIRRQLVSMALDESRGLLTTFG